MWNDVVDLRDFYATSLGQTARRMVRRRLRALWPSVARHSVLGVGYAAPFIGQFRSEARRVLALAPAAQGVAPWPAEGGGLVALGRETQLPFADRSIDRVLLAHALECAEQVRPMMRELWRVLADDGRLVVIAPNRRGLWARSERTPFGHGRPYSAGQLSQALRDALFMPTQTAPTLFAPPTRRRVVLASAPAFERVGQRWLPGFAGVLMMEASKQIYALSGLAEPARRLVLAPNQRRPGAARGRRSI